MLSEQTFFCLVECPTFHTLDIANVRHHSPTYRSALESYIATGGELLRSDASGVVVLKHVPYRIDGDDRRGRAYPGAKGRAVRRAVPP